ncbi:MAG: WcaF family extracellular polysaccharide biosynthesis acetyltransferase [Bacteroidetes bacterium]|nr:WcaF family extracellular polysaccharide biosynthesis acetyltransferase [Bacteroidota bacterium]
MTTTDLSKFNNSWYDPGANALKRLSWYCVNAVWINSAFPISGIKVMLLRMFGARIGKGVVIKPHVNIKYPWKLTIADHVWIGEDVWIDNLTQVVIEENVCISQGALLLCGNHNYKKETFDLVLGEIKLEKGVWIGAKSTVCPGVTCHSHAVLTVGSVATSNLEAYKIYQGNPAQLIRERQFMN